MTESPSLSIPLSRQKAHQLSSPCFDRAEELTGWMGAVQAQDYRMARWAVGIRLSGGDARKSVEDALASGRIVRTHILRPTWHFVRGEDLRWMRELSARRIVTAVTGYGKERGLTESVYLEANRRMAAVLEGGRELTRQELVVELALGGWDVNPEVMSCLTTRAEAEGLLCSGADRGGKPSFALLEERIPSAGVIRGDEALSRLAEMYFRSHSPARMEDFVWWSGLSLSQARRAVEAAGKEVLKEDIPVQQESSDNSGALHLLPAFDEYLIGYKDRSTVLDPQHYPKAFNRFGTFYPVVLYGGRVVGRWGDTGGKVSVSFFDPGFGVEKRVLEEAVDRYRAFRKM